MMHHDERQARYETASKHSETGSTGAPPRPLRHPRNGQTKRFTPLRTLRNDQISRHTLFLQQGRPAIAVSSQWFIDNMETQELTHTPKDNLSVVSYDMVAECTTGIAELVRKISLI